MPSHQTHKGLRTAYLESTTQAEEIFSNYSPKAKRILVNIYRDVVEVNIPQYSLSLSRIIVLV